MNSCSSCLPFLIELTEIVDDLTSLSRDIVKFQHDFNLFEVIEMNLEKAAQRIAALASKTLPDP